MLANLRSELAPQAAVVAVYPLPAVLAVLVVVVAETHCFP
jgi:hypothetical protein